MESFSADWLALREPADHAARSPHPASELALRLRRRPRHRAVDLACGTGSNVRFLLPRLPHITHWTLVDHDRALLDVARRSLEPLAQETGVAVETVRMDLRTVSRLPLAGCGLVTASALLDLVSDDWLQALAIACRQAEVDVLFALTYDGRIECRPGDPLDELVRSLVNEHQRTDKGFGPALGPSATRVARRHFRPWERETSRSDWAIGPDSAELQRQLVAGWANAARAISSGDARDVDAWQSRRLAHIEAGRSSIRVGHRDLAMWSR